ncbi:MAG: hypothetical protein ACF8XB_22465 [Planctomycetota bacterium JB042]
MRTTKRRGSLVLAVFLAFGAPASALPGGTFTVKGGSASTTQFDVHVSAQDAQGNRTVTIADNGAIEGSRVVSVTPNAHRVTKDDDCLRFKFKAKTADGDEFTVELNACTWELTNDETTDQVGSYKDAGGGSSTVLFG